MGGRVAAFSKDLYVDLRDWAGLDVSGSNDMSGLVNSARGEAVTAGLPLALPAGTLAMGSAVSLGDGEVRGQGRGVTILKVGHAESGLDGNGVTDACVRDLTIDLNETASKGLFYRGNSVRPRAINVETKNIDPTTSGSTHGGVFFANCTDPQAEGIWASDLKNADNQARALSFDTCERGWAKRINVQDADKALRIGASRGLVVATLIGRDLADNFIYILDDSQDITILGYFCDGCEEGIVFANDINDSNILVAYGAIRRATNKVVTARAGGGYKVAKSTFYESGPIGQDSTTSNASPIDSVDLEDVTIVDAGIYNETASPQFVPGRSINLRHVRRLKGRRIHIVRTDGATVDRAIEARNVGHVDIDDVSYEGGTYADLLRITADGSQLGEAPTGRIDRIEKGSASYTTAKLRLFAGSGTVDFSNLTGVLEPTDSASITERHHLVLCSHVSGTPTMTLPSPLTVPRHRVTIKNLAKSSTTSPMTTGGDVTVATAAGSISGATTLEAATKDFATYVANGSVWEQVA